MSVALLKQGLCSWTDAELIKSGKFFPSSATTSEDRLSFYSGKFPCVEVDMSTYVIPNQATCEKWAKSTVPGFLFHFKIFQFFTSQVIDVHVLPVAVQQKLSAAIKARGKLTWDETTPEMRNELWSMYNEALRPVHKMGKLGVVLFQFQIPFEPCERTKTYLQECRSRLAPEYTMAVEFRNLDWFNGENYATTVAFCEQHRLVLTCVDELLEARNRHHLPAPTFQPASALEPGASAETPQQRLAPRSEIFLQVTNPDCVYIRVHRRSGDHRLLSDQELTAWAGRLRKLIDSGALKGHVYMTWNTHHENQAVLNPLALAAKIPNLCYDWKAHVSAQPGRLESFFARRAPAVPVVAATVAPPPPPLVNSATVTPIQASPPSHPLAPPSSSAAAAPTLTRAASLTTEKSSQSDPEIIEIIEYDDDEDMIGYYTNTKATLPPKKHPLPVQSKAKSPASKRARANKPDAPSTATAKQQSTLSSFLMKRAAT